MVNDPDLPFSPAAERNKAPILEVLDGLLPPQARVLEIASGTGQHASHFAAAHPGWDWQPSDGDAQMLATIDRRCAALTGVRPSLQLDVLAPEWPVTAGVHDALVCANLLHIAPWATCAALMQGAVRHLRPGGVLVLYGPYLVDGELTAAGNLAFDADLRARDPRWGLRRLAEVQQAAGLVLRRRVGMPANNLLLAFGAPA